MAAEKIQLEFDLETQKLKAGFEDGVLDPLDAVSVKSRKVAETVSAEFKKTGNNITKAFAAGTATAGFKKLSVEVVSVFKNVDSSIKGTVVNLTDQRKALEANAATAIKMQSAITKASANVARPVKFNPASQLVPGIQTGKIIDPKPIEKATVATQKLTTQLRNLKNQLSQLDDAGQSGTAQFQSLAIQAAKLEDQIGDTSDRIRILASDTFAFDAISDGAQKATAVFGLLQGASALVGEENEDLQKTLVKLNAVQAISNGLLEVNRFLSTENAAKAGILTVVTKANTAATLAATAVTRLFGGAVNTTATSFKVLKGAIMATGIGLLLVLVGSIISAFSSAEKKVDEFGKTINEVNQKTIDSFNKLIDARLALSRAEDQISEQQLKRQQLINKYNEEQVLIKKQQLDQIEELKTKTVESLSATELFFRGLADKVGLSSVGITESVADVISKTVKKGISQETILRDEFDNQRKNAEATLAAELATINVEASKQTAKELAELEKQRTNSKLAEERARLKLVIDLTKEGSELNQQAIIALAEFEGRATRTLLDQELKDRKKALEETGIATLADYTALNNEISARRKLSEQDTLNEVNRLNSEYRDKQFQDEKDFQEKLKQIEIDRIEAVQLATQTAADIEKRIKLDSAVTNSGQETIKRVQAENNIIRFEAAQTTRELEKEEQSRTAGLARGTELRIKIEEEFAAKTVKVNEDAKAAIAENNRAFETERAQLLISTTEQIASSIFAIENNLLQRKINDIQTATNFELQSATLTARQKEALAKKSAAQIAALQAKQARNDRAAAILSVILNTAVAVSAALVKGPLAAGIAAALGAAQLAVILSQPVPKFADGGEVKGKRHSSGGVHIEAEGNEFITRRKQAMKHGDALTAMNTDDRAWNKFVENNYVRPALISERMQNAKEGRKSTVSERTGRIEIKTASLEKRVSAGQKQARKDADRIVNAVTVNRENDRNKW